MSSSYDAIVVGGGHNGLVAAAYLARSGARTVVLESRSTTGGAATTEAPWPEAPDIKVTRPEIYFGELTNTDVYVKTLQKLPPPKRTSNAVPRAQPGTA